MLSKRLSLPVVILAFFMPLYAGSFFHHGDEGKEVFSFLSTFDSPRNASLEKSAAAAPSTDPTITQLNPAAIRLPQDKKRIINMHWQTGEFADNQGSIFYTSQYKNIIYQVSYNWLDYGTIDGYDEYGSKTGKEYRPLSQLTTASFALPLKHIQIGTTLKFASDKLANEEKDRAALGAAFDWGIAWQSNSNLWGLGFVARDFGLLLLDYVDDNDDEFYPMAQTFAVSGFFHPIVLPRLTLMAESTFPRYAEPDLNIGAEYILGRNVYIRAGFTRTWLDLSRDFKELASSSNRPDESNEARMISAGLGFNSDLFFIDYAFSYLAQGLGIEHRIGLLIGF